MKRLAARIEACTRCPRLVAHREEVARTKRRAYREEPYWGKPIVGFGDRRARILLVGLAPGAHGANRTGRAFTGDRSGEFLYAALHRAGLASRPRSLHRDDGLVLEGAFITLPVRCVPPDNLPTRDEIEACAPWFRAEVAELEAVRAVVALGKIAFDAVLRLAGAGKGAPFAHGVERKIPWPFQSEAEIRLLGSYHVSQQNTQTGRLTPAMFDDILARARGAP
jgi:uracil-DNA glycosylase family 4